MKDGFRGKYFPDNTPSLQLWENVSPPLVQILKSATCSLLFIAGGNA
jgi:hypothetical protein